jgi:hypothetical protein
MSVLLPPTKWKTHNYNNWEQVYCGKALSPHHGMITQNNEMWQSRREWIKRCGKYVIIDQFTERLQNETIMQLLNNKLTGTKQALYSHIVCCASLNAKLPNMEDMHLQ